MYNWDCCWYTINSAWLHFLRSGLLF
jgi:hypothetical protein